MNLHHWIILVIVLVVGYFVGANYKLNLPLIG